MKIVYLLVCLSAVLAPLPAVADALDETLIYYTYFGSSYDVERLLERGASALAKDKEGWPALTIAASRKDGSASQISKLLLDQGADPNVKNKEGETPLSSAVQRGDAELVKLLILHHADIDVTTVQGRGLIDTAERSGFTDIVYYLSKTKMEELQYKSYLASPTYRNRLLEKVAYNSCASQYLDFYLASKQDESADEATIKKAVQTYLDRFKQQAKLLVERFPTMDARIIQYVGDLARTTVAKELNGLISNRNRRALGVGTEADMARRCQGISRTIRQSALQEKNDRPADR